MIRLGNHYMPESFNGITGLKAFQPPETIHAMVRDEKYCGDLYYCDLIAEALDLAGEALNGMQRVLDFGCSSGRVLTTLRSFMPSATLHGCDPNADAIAWAKHNAPGIGFFVSPEAPRLDAADGFYDLVYAISIWSHFSGRAASIWLDEMHRILKPGGLLLITTHGPGSLVYYRQHRAMSEDHLRVAMDDLDRGGFHYVDIFGPGGDWGVGKTDWGQAFIHPVYMLNKVIGEKWSLLKYMQRRSEGNQDVYLLRRNT